MSPRPSSRSRRGGSCRLLRASSLPLLLRISSSPSEHEDNGRGPLWSPPLAARGKALAMILYGSSLSPYVRKVLAFAAEKGIELEVQPTGTAPGQPSDEFLAASPLRKMPALRDGD